MNSSSRMVLRRLFRTASPGMFLSAARGVKAALLLAAAFGILLGAGMPQSALAGEGPAAIWRSGGMEVFALLDMPGGMDVSLFSGPASDEQRRAYFTDGKTPASVNAFLIKTDHKNVLVDSGWGESSQGKSGLIAQLAAAGVSPEQVHAVFLTHMHVDHVGGMVAGGKRVFPNARVVVSKPEYEYWMDIAGSSPGSANASLVKAMVKAYGTDLMPPFSFGASMGPGIKALDASGHTPGHTVFQLSSGGKTLLILGDLLHAAALQFPLPDECASYDIDARKAVESRRRILDLAAQKQWSVAGMHIPFPGVGSVEKDGNGYRFTPAK